MSEFTEPDGVKCELFTEPPNFRVKVTHPDGRFLEEIVQWQCEPRWGIDVSDSDTLEAITYKLLKELRGV